MSGVGCTIMDSSVDTRQVILNEQLLYHKNQSLLESLLDCNLVFKIDDNISEREIANALIERVGINAVSNTVGVVNFATVNNVLQVLNQNKPADSDIGPLESLMFNLVTSSRGEYIDERTGLFNIGPIFYMTKLINPMGLVMTTPNHITRVTPNSLSARLLINGNVNDINHVSLRIPYNMTVNGELLFQPKRHNYLLYIIMAPYPECIANSYSNVNWSTSYYGMSRNRYNAGLQTYAISFAVHNANITPFGAASQAMMRCKAYTNFHDMFKTETAHREIAVSALGLIPATCNVPIVDANYNREGSQSLILDNFIFTPKEWEYYLMEYSAPDSA